MAKKIGPQQFILLPARSLRATSMTSSSFFRSASSALVSKQPYSFELAEASVKMRVLDSVHEDGAKLAELSAESMSALRTHQPGLRIVPIVRFKPAVARLAVKSGVKSAAGKLAAAVKLKVVSKADGLPIAKAIVVAFTDFRNRIGVEGTTNKQGEVSLRLGSSRKTLERLYVYPKMGFWGTLKKNFKVSSETQIKLKQVDLAFTDALRHFCGNSSISAGRGVTVGVIDTGIAPHPDLQVQGGFNAVVGENASDFGDNGEGHGTHVAGIIAARGLPPSGLRGLAPEVVLRSYRVFPKNGNEASNYAILKAMDRAVADGCDLVNMSLAGDPDEATKSAIDDARAQGSLVIAAAGNDDRNPVASPASYSQSIAVSAFGRRGTFPKGSTENGDIATPYGTDKKNFVAAFTNIGPEIDVTGPGVGILSTVPGGYAPMSGTSMACPAVTGLAARLLSTRSDIMGMTRNQERSDAIAQLLTQAARPLGFGPIYEGQGLPQ